MTKSSVTDDPWDLERFVLAQESLWSQVADELRAGRKRSHWMWFVFPQLAGLGHSATARRYGIRGLEEARAYLDHPLLDERLGDATGWMLDVAGRDLRAILGTPDDLKFRSSMTLFAEAASAPEPFRRALERFCGGEADPRTLELLDGASDGSP